MEEELIRQQVLELKRSVEDSELTGLLEPVVAVGFGVVPLRLKGRTLHVAAIRPDDPVLMRALGHLLGREVEPHPFNHTVIANYLNKIYLQEGSVNFNTFPRPDFLEDPTNYTRLAREKHEVSVEPQVALPPDQVAFLDVSLKSELRNLDEPGNGLYFKSSDLSVPYRIVSDRAVVYRDRPLEDDCVLFLKRSYRYTGLEYRHGVESAAVSQLPHNLHPTEMQVARLGRGGEVGLFIYDEVQTAWPGDRGRFTCSYHFLSYGSRLRRDLTLKVNDLRIISRERIAYQETPASWTPDDLCRWLGFDWDDDYSHAPHLFRT